jgi:hypothetical protein
MMSSKRLTRRPLTIPEILAWTSAYREATGKWPTKSSGGRNIQKLTPLSEQQILQWADEHRQRTGAWPTSNSGPVAGFKGEKWQSINAALRCGARGLLGGSSLAKLLAHHRGVRNRKGLPPLGEAQVL